MEENNTTHTNTIKELVQDLINAHSNTMEESGEKKPTQTKEQVLELIEKKETLEKELSDLHAVLTSQNVGMTEPLIDGEGFPRSDIDVYQVRHARSNISRKKNDLKAD